MLRPLFPSVDLNIVVGTPFIYIRGSKTLVLSDLHLGFEEASSRGLSYNLRGSSGYTAIYLPRIQLRRTLSMLSVVLSELSISRVVINGDLKHAFDRLLRQEREEIIELTKFLRDRGVRDILVVRGNHDNFIKSLLRKLDVELINGFSTTVGDKWVLFTHGHEDVNIREYDILVIGHEHPALKCFDVYKFPCFIKIPLIENKYLVVMPATGPYHPGITVTPIPEEYLSPIIKKVRDLYTMSIVFWIDLGETPTSGVAYIESQTPTDFVKVEWFRVRDREYAVVEFKNYEIAHSLCLT
jgi:putative SbcD/Mre11-related phosphoesterase